MIHITKYKLQSTAPNLITSSKAPLQISLQAPKHIHRSLQAR